jgi:anti-sigma factor RsiW
MQPVDHPLAPEEVMAYLDGELPAERAARAAAHLDECAECRALADGLRGVSQALPAWEVASSDERVAKGVMDALTQTPQMPPPAVVKARRKFFGLPWWWGFAGALALVPVFVVVTWYQAQRDISSERSTGLGSVAGLSRMYRIVADTRAASAPATAPTVFQAPEEPPAPNAPAASAPMIARTAQIQLTTRDFDRIRARLEDILKRHGGYFGELGIASPTGSGRTLSGKLLIPAGQLDSAMSEIRQLGHVDSESQSGEEVTAAFADLEARLANSRHTEQRIVDLLRERTGKLSDVLDAERELGRVRGEIEQMEAERKALLKRVDYATLTLNVNEEYKAQLHVDGSPFTQFRNAAVDGFRSAAGSLVAIALFLLSDGPVLLLWAAILFFPARLAWRRWHARRRA